MTTKEILINAKNAKSGILGLSSDEKNKALLVMADKIREHKTDILKANALDVEAARGTISDTMIDRLMLTDSRIEGMAASLEELTALPDPCGEVLNTFTRPSGINVNKISVPLGVIGIIYESRPNVTSDAAGLCFKSSNVAVLRGGKEAYRSSKAIVDAMREGLASLGLPTDYINLIDDTTRASANEMMTAVGYIDMLIPRGGKGLIRACVENATVPCIETGTGICHIYVEGTADLEKALNIIENAKTSRPSVCNACEVCLVDREIAAKFLPMLKKRLTEECGHKVELRLDGEAMKYISGTPAEEGDFDREFLDYILAVKIVDNYSEAIEHISAHSTHHSDCIISENEAAISVFTAVVDSAAVYVNASTRFTDGGEFGLGCEMGISTQKLHARGPMGLRELTTYKYVIYGNGQVR